MGMFDDLQCDMELPIQATKIAWQTKCLERNLNKYAIRKDGRLVDTCSRIEAKEGAPPAPNEDLLSEEYGNWRADWFEHKVGPDVPVDFTGSVNFYGQDERKRWWEFCAFIENGICIKMQPVETHSE
jgi:hypothetical protein